jgi:hypothetical protein
VWFWLLGSLSQQGNMMQRQFVAMMILGGTMAMVASGCSDSGVHGVKVSGSVTKAGKAQDGVNVNFTATNPKEGEPKGTRTDADGKFQLRIKPGTYRVSLTRLVDKKGNVPKESDNPTEDFTQLEASGYLRNVFPPAYADPSSTPLKVEIPPGGKELEPFEVK